MSVCFFVLKCRKERVSNHHFVEHSLHSRLLLCESFLLCCCHRRGEATCLCVGVRRDVSGGSSAAVSWYWKLSIFKQWWHEIVLWVCLLFCLFCTVDTAYVGPVSLGEAVVCRVLVVRSRYFVWCECFILWMQRFFWLGCCREIVFIFFESKVIRSQRKREGESEEAQRSHCNVILSLEASDLHASQCPEGGLLLERFWSFKQCRRRAWRDFIHCGGLRENEFKF